MTVAKRPPQAKAPRRKTVELSTALERQLHLAGVHGYVREHHFHPVRRWRIDIAFPVAKLAVECEGVGAHGKPGRHQLTQHLHANTEKHSALAVHGWRLIRVTGKQIQSGHALRWIEAGLAATVSPLTFATPGNWGQAKRKRSADAMLSGRRWKPAEFAELQSDRKQPMAFNRIVRARTVSD